MNTRTVAIVEDEAVQQRILSGLIERAGFEPILYKDGESALKALTGTSTPPTVDVMLLDLGLPGISGLDVLERLTPVRPNLPIIVLTAQSGHRVIVDAMRAGARDFMVKPASAERIRAALENVMEEAPMSGEVESLTPPGAGRGLDGLIGDSSALARAKQLGAKAAGTLIPVLIEGESGVGKEVFARAIHEASSRRDKPFVAVNCGAIPENLVESTLFGHVKGAFTGATETRKGKFLEANGGTLFLDEVGELPIDVQPKLLRALQERMIDAVGASESQRVDLRIVSATNRTLSDQVAEGVFREDLFYRLNVFPVLLPPLRDRKEDIPALAQHFISQIAAAEGMEEPTLTASVVRGLTRYDWPGNVRQLQNALFRGLVLSDGGQLVLSDILPGSEDTDTSPDLITIAEPKEGEGADTIASLALPLTNSEGAFRSLSEIEKAVIEAALDHYDGKMSTVARQLGIGRSTLYRKLEDYNLTDRPLENRGKRPS